MINIEGVHFSYIELSLILVFFAMFLIQLYFYLRYFRGIIRRIKAEERDEINFEQQEIPISVVICARDEEDNLRQFLPMVLAQEHSNYEVIVVNDASTDGTEDYLKQMVEQHPNLLKTTFVPSGANNLSTKKLGITLGIKAAKNDCIVFTDADCVPEGKDWLSKISRNFTRNTEFVLGYGGYMYRKGFLNKLIRFDTLFIAIQYLGQAFVGKPYMGVGRNLAYRKSTFFRMNGFAGTLQLKSGDDDLLVNRAAYSGNTRIEVSPESVTWSVPQSTFKGWFIQKERHLSVSGYYNNSSKIRLSIEPISRAFFYLSFISVAFLGNYYTLGVAGLLFLTRFFLQMQTINKTATIFGEKKFYLTILLFDIFLPLFSLYILLFGRKKKNIRWK